MVHFIFWSVNHISSFDQSIKAFIWENLIYFLAIIQIDWLTLWILFEEFRAQFSESLNLFISFACLCVFSRLHNKRPKIYDNLRVFSIRLYQLCLYGY